MALQRFLQLRAQRSPLLYRFVPQSPKELWKLLLRPVQNILRKQSSSGTKLSDHNPLRRSQHAPHLVELPREQTPKDCMHIARGVEVASLPELRGVPRVIAELAIVKAQLHVSGKG